MTATPKKVTIRNGVRYNGLGRRIDPWPKGKVGGGTKTIQTRPASTGPKPPRPKSAPTSFGGSAGGDVRSMPNPRPHPGTGVGPRPGMGPRPHPGAGSGGGHGNGIGDHWLNQSGTGSPSGPQAFPKPKAGGGNHGGPNAAGVGKNMHAHAEGLAREAHGAPAMRKADH